MTRRRVAGTAILVAVLIVAVVDPRGAFPGHASTINRPAGQTASQMRLPDSAFSPATLSADRAESNDAADADVFGCSANSNWRSKCFGPAGRVTGYYQQADWQDSAGNNLSFRYMGSIFSSAANAMDAWHDASVWRVTLNQSSDCTGFIGMACTLLSFQNFAAYEIQYQQCTAEAAAVFPAAAASTDRPLISTTLSNMRDASAQLLRSVCASAAPTVAPPTIPAPPQVATPTSIPTPRPTATRAPTPRPTPTWTSIPFSTPRPSGPPTAAPAPPGPSLHIDRLGTSTGNGQPTSSFKKGETVFVDIGYSVFGAPGGAAVQVSKTVQYQSGSGWSNVGKASKAKAPATNGSHLYSFSFLPKKKYSIQRVLVRLKLGMLTQQQFVQFRVGG